MAQKFHKFKAATLDEAYRDMRQSLGEEAVVVRTAQVTEGGVLGLFGNPMVEITASVPERSDAPAARPRSAVERKYLTNAQPEVGSDERVSETVAYFRQLVSEAQERMAANAGPTPYRSAPPPDREARPTIVPFRKPQQRPQADDQLRNEIGEVRDMLRVLVAETPGAALPAELAPYYRTLVTRGVSRKAAAALVTSVVKGADPGVIRDSRVFEERLAFEIRRRVSVTGGIGLNNGMCRVVALVGPTGVGKTTNLAKLAAMFAVRERARVALVTSDTYRIAAPEQLRVYAKIIGVPTRVVEDTKQMAAALREFSDYDLILMDTAGGSQFNLKQLEELRSLLQVAQPQEVMLMLSANTQLEEMRSTVKNFKMLNPTSLFLSKLDETRRYGILFSLATEAGLPLSYLSTGQNVPDDISLAHPGMVADLVLKGGDRRGRSSRKLA